MTRISQDQVLNDCRLPVIALGTISGEYTLQSNKVFAANISSNVTFVYPASVDNTIENKISIDLNVAVASTIIFSDASLGVSFNRTLPRGLYKFLLSYDAENENWSLVLKEKRSTCIGLFHFNESLENSAAFSDGALEQLSPAATPVYIDTKFGKGLQFQSGDYCPNVRLPQTPRYNFGTEDFTIDFWYLGRGTYGREAMVIGLRPSLTTYDAWAFGIGVDYGGQVWFQVNSATAITSTTGSTTALHHVVLTRETGVFTLSLDGTTVGTVSGQTTYPINLGNALVAWESLATETLSIDELCIRRGVAEVAASPTEEYDYSAFLIEDEKDITTEGEGSLFYSQYYSVTIAANTSARSIINSESTPYQGRQFALGSPLIKANSLKIGDVISIFVSGNIGTEASAVNGTWTVKLGSTTVLSSLIALPTSLPSASTLFELSLTGKITSIGSSGSITFRGTYKIIDTSALAAGTQIAIIGSATAIDTTSVNVVDVLHTFSNASSSNTLTASEIYLRKEAA